MNSQRCLGVLLTGALVPVGVDKHNQPVCTLYSNAEGRFELYLPESEQGSVRVVAAAYAIITRIMLALGTDADNCNTDGLVLLAKIGKETAP